MTVDDFLEKQFPGSSESLRCLRPLMAQLTEVASFWTVVDISVLWSRLQRLTGNPYPPVKGARLVTDQNREGLLDANRLQRYCRHALSVYAPFGFQNLASAIPALPGGDKRIEAVLLYHDPDLEILSTQDSTQDWIPAHVLFVCHRHREIVLSIRGSAEVADWIIDFTCNASDDGFHAGMQAASRALDNLLFDKIVASLQKNVDYRLCFTGHSLGGGVATLLTTLWCSPERHHLIERESIQCTSFGSPCVISWHQADKYADVVVSVIYGRDIVPRLSTGMMTRVLCTLKELSNAVDKPTPSHGAGGSLFSPLRRSRRGKCMCSGGIGDEGDMIFPISLSEALELSRPLVHEQAERGSPLNTTYVSAGFYFDLDSTSASPTASSRASSRSSSPKKRTQEEAVSLLHRCYEIILDHADFEHNIDLVPAGRILQVVPRAHALLYGIPHTINDVDNDCLIFEMPSCQGQQGVPCLHPEAVTDHLIDKYVEAFCPELMIGREGAA